MDCPSCGYANPAGARFCGGCATPLGDPRGCPSCGSPNPAGQRFCNSCGRALPGSRSYTPEHLADKIRAGRGALEGERKQITVLFADVMGSMELAERSDPEEWGRIMDRFYSILCEGVHHFEGTVDKFTGDGIMALFGAPIAHEDHARRACHAALRLQHELASYAAELRRASGLSFSVRMGLNSGEVLVGTIGEDLAMEYTAVGHTVGLAQRMEQLAAADRIYLSRSTASLVEGYFVLDDLGEFQVKGASRPLRVHELKEVGAAHGALDVARERGFSRFVGRDKELGMLENALEQALAGEGQVIGIVGEAGVGKSRLCHEFAERHRAEGMPVYHVAAQAHAKSVPLLPVLEFLRLYFEIGDRDSDQTARARIARKLQVLDEAFDDDLPLMFDFLAVPDPERPPPRMDPEARQRRLLGVMKRLSRAQNAHEPGITMIEDLHWHDPASEVFLANHVEAVRGTRGLTVLNFRPEYHAAWMSRSYFRQVALAPLAGEALDEMLTDLLGSDGSLAGLAELIRERTQGNPFFVEELVRSLIEAGNLEGDRGAYRLTAPVEGTAVPASVQAVLAARIDRLEPREKTVLQAAAVIGKEVPGPVLERVVELDAEEIVSALRELVVGEFVYEQEIHPEALYAFKHPLTREVAYRSQLAERRAAVHAAVAQAIAEQYPERLDERAALLAQHWEAAGDRLEAARWHTRAAIWSGTTDPTQAVRHWRNVRELADALPRSAETVALGLGARISLLNYSWRVGIPRPEAEALFDEAERMASAAEDVRARAMVFATYAMARGLGKDDVRESVQLSREAIALAEESGDAGLYVAVASTCFGFAQTGDHREGMAICDRAIELAECDPTLGAGIVPFTPYANCLAVKGLHLGHLGDLAHALQLLDQGRALASERGEIEVAGWNHMWCNWLAYFQGEPEAALSHGQEGIEIAERIGGSFLRALGWFHLGLAERMRGDWPQAIETLERSLAMAREGGHGEHDAWRLALLGECHLHLGDPERARILVNEGLEIARARGHRCDETHAQLALARVLLGSAGAAAHAKVEAALERALELAQATGGKAFEPLAHVELAELARQRGDEEERERKMREAHRLFTEIGATGHAERLAAELPTPAS
jgi:class 3 adenylate cyclase/tetratricopeptide (TPR) repeat protein